MKNVIIVVAHKQCKIVNSEIYRPIIVGKNEVSLENAWRDNSEDNIAEKNSTYCELTALYWFWKNQANQYDNIGLCHYRRYFTKNSFSNLLKDLVTSQDIDAYMSLHDIVLPRPLFWRTTVAKVYYEIGKGKEKDLQLTRDAIHSLYPEYENSFTTILESKSACYCNMFIMRKEKLLDYCEWLYKILKYVEERIDMTGYDIQEKRVFGYLSEILLNVWVNQQNLCVKYLPIAYMELSSKEQFIKTLKGLYPIKRLLHGGYRGL